MAQLAWYKKALVPGYYVQLESPPETVQRKPILTINPLCIQVKARKKEKKTAKE